VLICSLISIAKTVGAHRIVPAVGIPYPLGDPKLSAGEEKERRKSIVMDAIRKLAEAVPAAKTEKQ
jgi:glycine reductase